MLPVQRVSMDELWRLLTDDGRKFAGGLLEDFGLGMNGMNGHVVGNEYGKKMGNGRAR